MSRIAHLRNRVRRDAVESAGQTAEHLSKSAAECSRIEQTARVVLDGAGDDVGSSVPNQLANARRALERAKKSLNEARNHADIYERSL